VLISPLSVFVVYFLLKSDISIILSGLRFFVIFNLNLGLCFFVVLFAESPLKAISEGLSCLKAISEDVSCFDEFSGISDLTFFTSLVNKG
jgi:hypothetical protein